MGRSGWWVAGIGDRVVEGGGEEIRERGMRTKKKKDKKKKKLGKRVRGYFWYFRYSYHLTDGSKAVAWRVR